MIWVLRLNPMQGHAEDYVAVARADTREALEAFLKRERVEPWADPGFRHLTAELTTWRKVFRKGSTLEWYNPPEDSLAWFAPFVEVNTLPEALAIAEETWRQQIAAIPAVNP